MDPQIVLTNVVALPCAITLVLFLLAWRPWSARSSDASSDIGAIWTAGLGCGLAYMVCHARITALPSFPPVDKADWIFYTAGAGIVLSFVDAIRARSSEQSERVDLVMLTLRLIVIAIAVWLILGAILPRQMSTYGAYAWIAALAFVGWSQWDLSEMLVRRVESLAAIAAFFPAAIGTSIALALSGSAKYGFFAGAICAAMGVLLVGSWLKRRLPLARGLLSVASPVLFLLLLTGRFLADLTTMTTALLIAAPLAAWIAELPPIRRLRPWQVNLIRVGCVALVTGAAVAVAVANFTPQSEGE